MGLEECGNGVAIPETQQWNLDTTFCTARLTKQGIQHYSNYNSLLTEPLPTLTGPSMMSGIGIRRMFTIFDHGYNPITPISFVQNRLILTDKPIGQESQAQRRLMNLSDTILLQPTPIGEEEILTGTYKKRGPLIEILLWKAGPLLDRSARGPLVQTTFYIPPRS